MIYWCFNCGKFSFEEVCPECDEESSEDNIPLDPAYYPELNYKSKGFIIDLFNRKKKKYLELKRKKVIKNYNKYKHPYFVNFMYLAGNHSTETGDPATDNKLDLFKQILLRLGFNEINEFPKLLSKLVRSTSFRFRYKNLSRRFEPHVNDTLSDTLKSYISESSTAFREDYNLLLYYFLENNLFLNQLDFNTIDSDKPLMSKISTRMFLDRCEQIYNDILVSRFMNTLETFDKEKLITIYDIDAMSGYEFEDFLVTLFSTLRYLFS